MRAPHDLPHRIDRTERIRHMRDRHHARPIGQQRFECVELQVAAAVDRDDPEARAGGLAGDLPRHDVGVVLHLRHDDLVARAKMGRPHAAATRLIASVVPRTKTISRGVAALRNRCTVVRADSYADVARSLSAYTPRCTFAFSS